MSISLAMLVLDPPLDRLAALLDYVRPVISQTVVVVDSRTGTRAVDALSSLGCELVPFDWCDDFAAARNAALPHVRGDWVLHLDPDELPSHAMLDFIAAADDPDWTRVTEWCGQAHLDPLGYLFWTRSYMDGHPVEGAEHDWHCRMFRRDLGRWYRAVHELVALDGMPESRTRETPYLVKAPRPAYFIHSKVTDEAKQTLYARLEAVA